MTKTIFRLVASLALVFSALHSCKEPGGKNKNSEAQLSVSIPAFSSDSAYSFIKSQLDFGPRVPNTPAHTECGDWLAGRLKAYGADLIEQRATVMAFDGTPLKMRNLIAQFQPQKKNRILLMAHWDSRPFADHDPDQANFNTPIPGANDGGSGVGVLLEIARHLKDQPTTLGVDIILFDAEDYGVPDQSEFEWKEDTWCLGSQYWAKNPHVSGYGARFGILLDMVGAANAQFTREEVSRYYANSILNKVWGIARELGHGAYFSYQETPQIIDDHRYVNEITGIPSIDIIQYDHTTESNFGSFWHTLDDDLSNISSETLKAVGETVMAVIYREQI